MQKVVKRNFLFNALKILVMVLVLVAIVVALFLATKSGDDKNEGAITTNGIECANIGKSIAKLGGNVADVAVATLICEGITCPQSSGLGGGFLLTIYIKSTGKIETLNAREIAPKLATSTMYVNDTRGSVRGGKAVAVPGELKGLWQLHQKY
jgi:gamma-glutamyltranspeptidase / glutathione hydrolase / leukotriene-C4 hydrolase